MAAMLRREVEVVDVVMTRTQRGPRGVVAHLHRRRPRPSPRAARPLRDGDVRGTDVRHAVERRAAEGAARRARSWPIPELLILDEPAAGLDLGAREDLVSRLGALADDDASPPLVLITHHVDEIPRGFTHALLLRHGRAISSGPIDEALTSSSLSECFGIPLGLDTPRRPLERTRPPRLTPAGFRWISWRQVVSRTTARQENQPGSAGEAGEEAGTAVLDLVAEHVLEHRSPERSAVVEVHDETAARLDGRHRCLEDPRGVGLAVGLAPLEAALGRRMPACGPCGAASTGRAARAGRGGRRARPGRRRRRPRRQERQT